MKGTKTLLSYILFIIGLQWKTVYAMPQTCSDGEFMCANKNCINGMWKCDGENDCGDESDEENCPKTTKSCSPSTHFKCGNGQCIPQSWTCDGMDDCGDNTDETTDWLKCPPKHECGSEHFQCAVSKQCIMRYKQCDGNPDCGVGDNSDEDEKNCEKKTCASDEFQCNNGNCISQKWVCDKNNDCFDGSDELDCNLETCNANQFKCNASGHCIFLDYKCDGDKDCIDGSDEKDCKPETTAQSLTQALDTATNKPISTKKLTTTTTIAPCLNHQFECVKSGKCIHKAWICDGEEDCANGEDELLETCLSNNCTEDKFRCDNGKCIEFRAKCDGTHHCSDGSDEKDCGSTGPKEVTCGSGTFRCGNSSRCIDFSMVCNGVKNCPNGEDEDPKCGIDECKAKPCDHYCTDKDIGYECKCKIGYRLAEDGKTCVDIDECKKFGACSQKCENTKGSYVCYCDRGYTLGPNKRTCSAGAPEPLLVFSNRYDVRQITTNGGDYKLISNTKSSAAIALDISNSMVYWSDLFNKTINRIHKSSGKSVHSQTIMSGLLKPESLAIDWVGKKLYWVDTGLNTISVSNLDGSHSKTLVQGTEEAQPRTIAVYPEKGYMFWSVWGDKGSIQRANLNGENPKTILNYTHVKYVSSIAVDHTLGRIFWADMSMRHICSSDINGQDKKETVTGLTEPYAVTVFEDYVYWTDMRLKKLFKANKFSGKDVKDFGNYLFQPLDIAVFHPLVQTRLAHPCENGNGGCSHLCFVDSSNKTACACPDGYLTLGKDKKTCIINKLRTTVKAPTTACYYQCHSSTKCLSKSQMCNGLYDCPEHDDERNCEKTFTKQRTVFTDQPTVYVRDANVPAKQSGDGSDSMITIIVGVICGFLILLVIIAIIVYRRKRSPGGLSIVYETDQDHVDKYKDDAVGVSVKFFNKNKKQNSDKNFDNVNFKEDLEDPRVPLQMNEVDVDTVVDEYPGSEYFDDRTPIVPR